jgi:hypothetical protein
MKRTLLIVLAIIVVLVAIWFGTVLLQRPPQYPSASMDIDKYFDEHRLDYSVSRAGLIEDVDALVAFTEELHVDPYRITTQEAFLEKAEEIKSKIRATESEEIPVLEAFYYLQELAVFVEDVHTTLYPLNWEQAVASMFPLVLTSVDGRLFVKDNYGENDVPERAEILAVNGVSIEEMTDEIMKYVPGTLLHMKQAMFAEQFSLFAQTYYQMASPWQITYAHDGTITTTTIEGITQASFEEATLLRPEFMVSEIKVSGEAIPVLALDFPGFNNSEWDDFKAFTDGFFAQNKDKPYIIIDARHHRGGDGDWGVYLLSHLTLSLKGPKQESFKVSPLHRQIIQYGFQSAYYDMNIPQFLWGLPLYKFVEQDDPYYWIARGVLETEPGAFYDTQWEHSKSYLIDETSDRFQGKVYLLISHETNSAGVYMAGLFRDSDLGTIVGQETGGRVYMSSDMMPVFLPNSNLIYMVPVSKFIVSNDNPDQGIVPDVTVGFTPEDYVNHRDKDIERVIELIEADY